MNAIAVFALEVITSLVISVLVLRELKELLRRVGAEICDRQGTAEFWITYVQLMMLIGPLLIVGFFSKAGAMPALGEVAQFKSSLLVVLSGQFISLMLIGRAVWKSVFTPTEPASLPVAMAVPGATDAPRPHIRHGGES